jgi:hypothetical protein
VAVLAIGSATPSWAAAIGGSPLDSPIQLFMIGLPPYLLPPTPPINRNIRYNIDKYQVFGAANRNIGSICDALKLQNHQ